MVSQLESAVAGRADSIGVAKLPVSPGRVIRADFGVREFCGISCVVFAHQRGDSTIRTAHFCSAGTDAHPITDRSCSDSVWQVASAECRICTFSPPELND